MIWPADPAKCPVAELSYGHSGVENAGSSNRAFTNKISYIINAALNSCQAAVSKDHLVANVHILALLAYAAFAVTDVCVKAAGGRLPIFETAFIVTFFAGAVLVLTRHPNERWRDFLQTGGQTFAIHGRALCGVVSSLGGVYAFTHIPFAQAYAIIFLAPVFVVAISVLFLKEQVPFMRWIAVFMSFTGVLLVLKPGYQPLAIGHFAAACVGLATGGAIVVMRRMGGSARKTSVLGMLMTYLLVLNGVTTIVWGFVMPTWREFAMLGLAGVAYGLGQWAFVLAVQVGSANQIAPMQYSQLLWAVGFGALFFNEYLDGLAGLGIAIIVASGLLTFIRARMIALTAGASAR